jgi:septal ring factor EnvC (AmiA/AmiB activator)
MGWTASLREVPGWYDDPGCAHPFPAASVLAEATPPFGDGRSRGFRGSLAAIAGLLIALLSAGWAVAQTGDASERRTLIDAKHEAAAAQRRSALLERQAAQANDEAGRARAQAGALAARIEGAEADLTAAETRIRMIEQMRRVQRARLAEHQGPVIRLTAALQTMARRPPALTLIQPGSLDEFVHVRSLLASTLPIVQARTASLRAEVENGNRLRREADLAAAALIKGREELSHRRVALADFERRQRARSASLMQSAMSESDRALALGEEARELAALEDTRQFQNELRRLLAALPGPTPRPGTPAAAGATKPARYRLPVEGRLVRGMGEISDAGVHARGLTPETSGASQVIAPAGGRVAYAGRFRSYGRIVIIDHGSGWTSAITQLGALAVKAGDRVAIGDPIGSTAPGRSRVDVELRRQGRPFPISPLIAGS